MSSYPGHPLPSKAVAARSSGPDSRLQVIKRALRLSTGARGTHTQPESGDVVKATYSSSLAPKILAGLAVAVLLEIAIPIALIIRAESRPSHVYRQGLSVVARGEYLLGMTQQG